ncbi:type IV pilus modification protein PilV [Pseudomonas sp. FSL R10-1350]|nr:type IV pilus modification protein PilV [Pseudomonas sp. FSL R10-1350]
MAHMNRSDKRRQSGVTLIEVLVATVILAGGLLGAAAVQLNALKHTDSALMTTQASFIAYDMLDRIRANPAADYAGATAGAGLHSVLGQDLSDFKRNVRQFGGASAKGSIAINERQLAITLQWDDTRAGGQWQTFSLTSQIASGFAVGAS